MTGSASRAKVPRPPASLGPAGRRLWRSVLADFELAPVELERLRLAAGQLDLVAALEAQQEADGLVGVGSKGQPRVSGVVAELSRARALASKLLDELHLPGEGEDVQTTGRSAASRRAQHAANARWARRPRLVGTDPAQEA